MENKGSRIARKFGINEIGFAQKVRLVKLE